MVKITTKKKRENYLERVPIRNDKYRWNIQKNDIVTIEKENKGIFNKIFQRFFKKPKISYIHLDENGSFVWMQIDGKKSLLEIGRLLEKRFGDSAKPIYERLVGFFATLNDAGFIKFKK